MKKLILTALLFCFALSGATAQVRYCMSYADYQQDKWTELDTLKLKGRSLAHRPKTGNDSLDQVLRNQAFALLYHDTLLVNMAHAYYQGECFGNGYVLGYRYGDGQICIVNRLPSEAAPGASSLLPAVGGLMGGALGGGIMGAVAASTASSKNSHCYLVRRQYDGGRVEVRMMGDDFMKHFQKGSPEFYASYMSEKKKKKRELASHVLPLLKEWQLIQ